MASNKIKSNQIESNWIGLACKNRNEIHQYAIALACTTTIDTVIN